MSMFKSIRDLFSGNDWSQEMVDQVCHMLLIGSKMFNYTTGVVIDGKDAKDFQTLLYDRDRRINISEREVRRSIIKHLSMGSNQGDVPSALVFMNVIKDAERIGDYVKNLYDISNNLVDKSCEKCSFGDFVGEYTTTIKELFPETIIAFGESNEDKANHIISTARELNKDLENKIIELTSSELSSRDIVCLVLICRFYKRIAAHLSNIATSVVMPVDLMDFFDAPKK